MKTDQNIFIPGLRQPTQEEQQRIYALWQDDLSKNITSASIAYTLMFFPGCILLGMCAIALFSAGEDLGSFLITAAVGALLTFLGRLMLREKKRDIERKQKMERGEYLVAPATALNFSAARHNACCIVQLSDGMPLLSLCRAPYPIVNRMCFQHIGSGPILLIVIDGDKDFLSVPVQNAVKP